MTRLTATASYSADTSAGPLSWTIGWGQHRDFYGVKDAYLAEAHWRARSETAFYGRGESVEKNILTAGGNHPPGFTHPHVNSRIGALTLGLLRNVTSMRKWSLDIGGDVTGYRVPVNLRDNYGQPWSFHAFVRLHPQRDSHRAH